MRRRRGVAVALVVLAAAWAVGEAPSASQPAAERPNVLLIVTDDQRVGTLGQMRFVRRAFRERGTEFSRAFATTPVCCPSWASLLTGRYAHNHGVTSSRDPSPFDPDGTIQHQLQEAGYRTALVGKFLTGWGVTSPPAYFDHSVLVGLDGSHHRLRVGVQGRVRTVERYSTAFIANSAVRHLRSFEADDARPWFLVVGLKAPHRPLDPAPHYATARVRRWKGNPAVTEADQSDKPPYVQEAYISWRRVQRIRRQQIRMLLSVDDYTRRLLRNLNALGEGGETLTFFLSDNGWQWGEHGLNGKGDPYPGSVRVPFFLRWPGRLPGGVRDTRWVGILDVAPTILDAANLPPDPSMDGRSLLSPERRDRILTERWSRAGDLQWAANLGDGYHYIEHYDEAGEISFREFYDVAADRWRLENLLGDGDPATDPPDAVAFSAQLAADMDCAGTEGPTACP